MSLFINGRKVQQSSAPAHCTKALGRKHMKREESFWGFAFDDLHGGVKMRKATAAERQAHDRNIDAIREERAEQGLKNVQRTLSSDDYFRRSREVAMGKFTLRMAGKNGEAT